MSVTFNIGKEEIRVVNGEPVITYSNIYPENFDPKQIIEEDEMYGPMYAQNPWEFNVSNVNALRILEIIGHLKYDSEGEPEFCGTISNLIEAEEKIVSALADRHFAPEMDWGTPINEFYGEQGALIIDCGRRSGYETDRLSQLLELVHRAKETGGIIFYG